MMRLHLSFASPEGEGFGPRKWTVIKPHGSCNTVPVARGSMYYRNLFVGYGQNFVSVDMRFSFDNTEIEEFLFRGGENQLSPAMRFFAPGKQVMFGGNVIRHQYSELAKAFQICEQIVLIGVACNFADTHIWDLLLHARGAVVYFGNRDLHTFDKWAFYSREGPSVSREAYFREAIDIIQEHEFNLISGIYRVNS